MYPKKPLINNSRTKILTIVGPTASGKSELAVKLAKEFNGEIISADSRQIYKGMDIGTGKVEGSWQQRVSDGRKKLVFLYKNVPHYLIDFTNPKKTYSAALFKRQAQKVIKDIAARGKLPIICGGTAHWIDAVAYNQNIPEVGPNPKLRADMEKQTADALYQQLKKLDPQRANTIDKHNKRRLVRALEIVITTGQPVPYLLTNQYPPSAYPTLWLGINRPWEELYKKIDKRLKQRLKAGMIEEVKALHSPPILGGVSRRAGRSGISWKRLESFGLEYKFIALYLQNKLSYEELLIQLSYAIKHYAKRQMTWFKRNKDIHWIQNYHEAVKLARNFLS